MNFLFLILSLLQQTFMTTLLSLQQSYCCTASVIENFVNFIQNEDEVQKNPLSVASEKNLDYAAKQSLDLRQFFTFKRHLKCLRLTNYITEISFFTWRRRKKQKTVQVYD